MREIDKEMHDILAGFKCAPLVALCENISRIRPRTSSKDRSAGERSLTECVFSSPRRVLTSEFQRRSVRSVRQWCSHEFGSVRNAFEALDEDESGDLSQREWQKAVRDFRQAGS